MTVPAFFSDAQAFREWLQAHAGSAAELLVGFHKVASGRPCMSWSESVDEALCFGWIDGVRRRVDEHTYTIRFTPRKTSSIWSAINIAKYRALEAAGRVTPAGAQAFSHRTDTRSVVYAYEQPSVAALSVAETRTFKRDAQAWRFFEAAPPSYRKTVLHWVTSAKKAETRSRRFAALLAACSAGQRLR